MLNEWFQLTKVYVACGYTDLRRGIDGLVGIVQEKFQLNPYEGTLFLFSGKRTDRLKGLFWDGDGFLLLYKRLEKGAFQWPRTTEDARSITQQLYRWPMEGLRLSSQGAQAGKHRWNVCGLVKTEKFSANKIRQIVKVEK